jgi:preprotein translocase subunit SecF
LNATIIVFDRVRENRKMLGDSMSFADTVNLSIHQTLTRSISTTTTTLITAVAVYIFGVESIRNFALPLIIGIVAGLFSSIFLAGVFWVEGTKILRFKKKDAKSVNITKPRKRKGSKKNSKKADLTALFGKIKLIQF